MENDKISEGQLLGISLHAIAGLHTLNAMRINGHLDRQLFTTLVDSGSTHNFVNKQLAANFQLQPIPEGHLEIMMASGERLIKLCQLHLVSLWGIPTLWLLLLKSQSGFPTRGLLINK
ncbi:hypothetical protein PanWU01x14_297390 [Parasponia andersonii]|uniref:Aspartic peptidase domain containing protein n=1 Tax=Parasponia andersonii TaxID=3476 RepID=A0A2P5AV55_PARAD|nr:hypothetical protein PanWU01x14_297390 [Parasponia andersonii]